MIQMNHSTNQH